MIFDMNDVELMKLCGLCRYLPIGLKNKYYNPLFLAGITGSLRAHRMIKITPNKECIRLTSLGKGTLADMGFEFPDDARPRKTGSVYKRRMISADINVLLNSARIDVFAENILQLNCKSKIYISALTIRADTKSKAIAGTRFLGMLKSDETVYIPYYVENEYDGIYPDYEKDTFNNLISNVRGVKNIKLIFTGKTLEELWGAIFDNEAHKLPRGLKPFSKAFEVMAYNICLMPLNRDGVLQIKIMTAENYRARIVQCVGAYSTVPNELSYCDGQIIEENKEGPLIIAIDMDIKRILSAITQAVKYNKIPFVVCLKFQHDILVKMLENKITKIRFIMLLENKINTIFTEFDNDQYKSIPFRTEKGEYIRVNEKI